MIDTKALRKIATEAQDQGYQAPASTVIALLDELDRLRAALGEALELAEQPYGIAWEQIERLRAVQRGEK